MMAESASVDVVNEAVSRIPVRNAWHLLLYAWDLAKYRGQWSANSESSPQLLGLLARVLADATRNLLRRQLGRSFAIRSETIRGLRGRIDLATSLKRFTFQHGAAHCSFSELSVNTPKNRILRATLHRLAADSRLYHSDKTLETKLRHELRTLVRAMDQVPLVSIHATDFSRLQLGRNDQDYAVPLTICALIHWLEMPTETEGDHVMSALLRDEITFAQLFERFVRNFCRIQFPDCDVRSEVLNWPDELNCDLIPAMRTDVTLTTKSEPHRRLVIDTKYYASALTSSLHGVEKVRSENLYQLYAYLRTQEQRSTVHRNASGMLLYPTTVRELNKTMLVQGHRMNVATLDLSVPWEKIEDNLKSLVESGLAVN
jgi:5-methylcytosine-specific restriction enzyme subunit McrC